MAATAVILVRVSKPYSPELLAERQRRCASDIGLVEAEDFYSGGPLVMIEHKNQGPIPVEDCTHDWFDLNLARSYYSREYRRGDPLILLRCIEWLERNFPEGEVWYGNDISDDSIRPVDEAVKVMLQKG